MAKNKSQSCDVEMQNHFPTHHEQIRPLTSDFSQTIIREIFFSDFFLASLNSQDGMPKCLKFVHGKKYQTYVLGSLYVIVTLSTIIMEVEHGGLEDDFSFQGDDVPLP